MPSPRYRPYHTSPGNCLVVEKKQTETSSDQEKGTVQYCGWDRRCHSSGAYRLTIYGWSMPVCKHHADEATGIWEGLLGNGWTAESSSDSPHSLPDAA